MARWKLLNAHYLQTRDTEWEYKEVDRTTGRPKRTVFPVPRLLDPAQPSDWTHRDGRDEGEIIVCHEGKGEAKDITFFSEPTPDMLPLDAEAKTITAKLGAKWKHPIESLPGSYADAVLDDFQKQLAEVQAQNQTPKNEGVTELLTAMAAMMKQNQEMMAALVGKSTPAPAARRA